MTTQDEYNQWFKSMLEKHLKNHPYQLTNQSSEGINYLDATILHPDDEEKNIIISTYGKELTLSIWEHHEHHDSYEDCDHEQEFCDLCKFIDDIMNDKVFFYLVYKENRLAYGGRDYELEKFINDNADKIEFISWSGEHDKIINKKG